MVSNKALFNVAIQSLPILVSLYAIPVSISNMGKPLWYFYSVGLTILLLPNYFSFGTGPYLVRKLVLNTRFFSSEKWTGCLLGLMVSAATYLLISSLFFFTSNNQDVFTSSNSEFLFSGFFILGGLITYFIIISKATLESKNDFYFLGFVRAIFASGLIIFPIFSFDSEWYYSLLVFLWSFFYLGAYMIRLGKKRVRLMFKLPKSVEKRTLLEFIKEVWPFGLFLVCWSFFLFFDRMLFKFYIDKQTLADHVTMQDLFNRVAIISGNISLVYYPTLSKVTSVPKQFLSYYYKQVAIVLFFFFVILITSFFILDEALQLWLKREYSSYIGDNAIIYLIGIITFNFSIIQIRAMHAQKKEKVTVKYLCFFLILFITFVGILAFIKEPSYVPIGQGIVFLALIVVFHNQLVKK